jgi:hypothetical protein
MHTSSYREGFNSLHSFNVHLAPNAMTTSALGGSASLPRDQQIASSRRDRGRAIWPFKPWQDGNGEIAISLMIASATCYRWQLRGT